MLECQINPEISVFYHNKGLFLNHTTCSVGMGEGGGIWGFSLGLTYSLRQGRVDRESLKGSSLIQPNPSLLLPFHWLKPVINPRLASRGLKNGAFRVPEKKEYRIGFGEHSTVCYSF